ncbi:MAG: putative Calcium/calmodulin-dependent protein kinase kinase 1 [Streblomastix strix]|uniref:Putative Calcium/calmodulin-dependent protein kinase kinase 1 n=1 Tax=Streblomastix strix TaxID=222440 RepID=A0A5J4X2Z6_9EUKA|nr:MAG: putative Calcium/calmodulin-dependent protein kinase kinase 1 [Streblomastix strix]
MIGKGAFGKVKLVHIVSNPSKLYAMKVIKKEQKKRVIAPQRGPRKQVALTQEETINREVAIMKKMRHPNIVKLREVIDDTSKKKLYMILEFVKGGPCFIEDQEPFSEDKARADIRDIIAGISYMHKNHIVHHDIKPDNILRKEDDTIKICDFGVSSYYEDMTTLITTVKGTPPFIPPEAVNPITVKNGYLPSLADIYAIGVTLFMFIYGHLPYDEENKYNLYKSVINNPIPFDKEENKEITSRISSDLRNLLEGTLEKDPQKRFTIEQLKQHPWVTCNGTLPLPEELDEVNITKGELDTALTPMLPLNEIKIQT